MRDREEDGTAYGDKIAPLPGVAGSPYPERTGAFAHHIRTLSLVVILVALLASALAANANAAGQRNLEGGFGSPESIEVANGGIAIDQTTGDVLIPKAGGLGEATIRRFHADGTPAPFEALGTNVIDGAKANGKECVEEPASCDQTPENGIAFEESEFTFQIAIDESGGATDGDIYLAQGNSLSAVYIFADDGRYLGQLTGFGGTSYKKNAPVGIAVDSTGSVYVADVESQINVFKPGQNPAKDEDFVGNLPYPTNEDPSYVNGGKARRLAFGSGPTAGTLFAAYTRNELNNEKVGGIFQLDPETGELLSRFDQGDPETSEAVRSSVAVNPTNGNVLDGSGNEFEVQPGSAPVQVSHLDPTAEPLRGIAVDGNNRVILVRTGGVVSIYGPPAVVPSLTIEPAEEVFGTTATVFGTVNPSALPLAGEKKCRFEYGPVTSGTIEYKYSSDCEGTVPPDSNPHRVKATIKGLEPSANYGFRLVASNVNGSEKTGPLKFTTTVTTATEPASAIGLTSATLNGSLRPEGRPVVKCVFEYGLSTSSNFEKSVPCNPAAANIGSDYLPHKVDAAIGELQSERTYRFRLVASFVEEDEAGEEVEKTEAGEEESFDTSGVPRVIESRASGADQGSFTLEARINPSGFGTHYRFEWGPTSAYGNVAPLEFEPFIGSGAEPILVKARVAGLATGTAYHYRVVAESNHGSAESPDQIAETLNACGLPEGRCFEEVSRHEAGPVAIPGESNGFIELHFQAAAASGGLAYPVESGYPDATKGAEVLYRGLRTPGGWESTQLSAPLIRQSETVGVSQNSKVQFLSDDLSCGILESTSPLTPNPSMELVREFGGSNLYRINPDGSYTPITTLPPLEQGEILEGLGPYRVAWASQNCGVTVFRSGFAYPGIPAVKGGTEGGAKYLYEWRDGTLRNAGSVPGPGGGEVAVGAVAGAGEENTQNSVSADGSRVFFSAERQTSPNPEEFGRGAIFMREDGRVTRDVSLSQTAVPDRGATYQWATADGSKVFFTANSGLASGTGEYAESCVPSTGEGCELYEYDLGTEKLIDRTATSVGGGAEVRGFLGASADGSRVYFASANRLVAGKGNSQERNRTTGSYSIYSERDGVIAFVGTLGAANFGSGNYSSPLIELQANWVSQVSPDGRYLIFESRAPVTDYPNEGFNEVYLYDADTKKTTCVSCRQDGRPSDDNRYGSPKYELLRRGEALRNLLHPPRFLTERNGEAKVFFNSPDPLAPGAVAGQNNVYEWSHDQIFRLTSAPPGSQVLVESARTAFFGGASADASDVYLITPETLTWEDGDERQSAYDARIGGGFQEPPPPAIPCRASAERSCAAPPPSPAEPQAPATTGDSGSQNFQPKKKHHKKHSKKKQHKKHSKSKKAKKKPRRANGNRRNGK